MRKTHTIKINDWFVDDIMEGRKRFEVRKNDRLYQAGDLLRFEVVDSIGVHGSPMDIEKAEWIITFVESGYGLHEGYVAFGFKPKAVPFHISATVPNYHRPLDSDQWEAANPALAMRLGDTSANLDSVLPTHSELYIQHLKEVGE